MLLEGVVKFVEDGLGSRVWGVETAEGFVECSELLDGVVAFLIAQGKPKTDAGVRIKLEVVDIEG